MSELSAMKCTACRGDEPTLTDDEIVEKRGHLSDRNETPTHLGLGGPAARRPLTASRTAGHLAWTSRLRPRGHRACMIQTNACQPPLFEGDREQ